MEEKVYFLDSAVDNPNKKLVIFITYDKSRFLANNSQYHA